MTQPRRPMWGLFVILAVMIIATWACWWGITRLAWDDCTARGGQAEPVYGTGGWTCAGSNPP